VNGKFKMMNPFIQNYGHIEALKNCVEANYHHLFISVVSFTKRCTFKMDELDYRKIASNQLLVYDVELFDYIHRKVSVLKVQHDQPLLNENEILKIYNAIKAENITDQKIRESHIQALKANNTKSESCCVCNKPVSDKVKTFCLTNKKFNGKIYCFQHQKR
jgi:hypothetical protein